MMDFADAVVLVFVFDFVDFADLDLAALDSSRSVSFWEAEA